MLRWFTMLTVRARVRNGRLIVDEPTDLPEGTEVELVGDDAGPTEEELAELRARAADGTARVPVEQVLSRLPRP